MPVDTQVPLPQTSPDTDLFERSTAEISEMAARLGLPRGGRHGVWRNRLGLRLKRSIDFGCALFLLGLAAPAMLIIAALIKFSSPGPVLFRQLRIGHSPDWAGRRSGLPRAFEIFKFRTMKVDVPAYEVTPATHDDDRITRVGRFLRKTSLDELPQLFNVLRGEMNLVGPRPLPMSDLAGIDSDPELRYWFELRCKVKPGITGPWQVAGRSELGMAEMIRLDIDYIQTWSLWVDIQMLVKTVPAVLRGRGAR